VSGGRVDWRGGTGGGKKSLTDEEEGVEEARGVAKGTARGECGDKLVMKPRESKKRERGPRARGRGEV